MALEVTKKNLVLGFSTGTGAKVNLTIRSPKEDMQGTVVAGIMDEIISSQALGDDSLVTHKVEAKYVIQETEEVDLTEA